MDQAATEPKALAAVQALLLNQGPPKTSDIPWVALIGQSVSIASAHSQSAPPDTSLETAWRAETETLKSILTRAPQTKLGRIALVETLAAQIRNRMKLRLPTLLTGYLFSTTLLFSHCLQSRVPLVILPTSMCIHFFKSSICSLSLMFTHNVFVFVEV